MLGKNQRDEARLETGTRQTFVTADVDCDWPKSSIELNVHLWWITDLASISFFPYAKILWAYLNKQTTKKNFWQGSKNISPH